MNLLPTEEQQQIVDMVRGFLAASAPLERLRPDKFGQIGNPDAALWPKMAELGILGLGVPEEGGGLGLSAVEEALTYIEFGRALVSVGVLGATLGAHLAARTMPDIAAAIMAGTSAVGLATPRGTVAGDDGIFSGEFHLIEANEADFIVLLTSDAIALFRRDEFMGQSERLSMDSHMRLMRAALESGKPLSWSSVKDGIDHARANLLIAAYATGVAEAALVGAVDYAKVREQFGKPIGSFQAIKHKCADMAIAAEVASCQVSFASVILSKNSDESRFHALASRIVAVDAALKNGATGIQVHGAIGFTAEVEAHLFVKRAHLIDFIGGDQRVQKGQFIGADAMI